MSVKGSQARPRTVKSAERTLRLLEFFDVVRQPVTVIEVSRSLNYPQSSTSALLRSMVSMGYLKYDEKRRTYLPTERVSLLGIWQSPKMFGDPPLVQMMREIADRVGHSVVLGARNGDRVQYIHVHNQNELLSPLFRLGMRRPLHNTSTGLALLSGLKDKEVRGMYHRMNAYAKAADDVVDVPKLLLKLRSVRMRGYAFTSDAEQTKMAFVAVRLPSDCASQSLVVGAGGPADVINGRARELVEILREEIDAHLTCGTLNRQLETAGDLVPVLH